MLYLHIPYIYVFVWMQLPYVSVQSAMKYMLMVAFIFLRATSISIAIKQIAFEVYLALHFDEVYNIDP